MFDEDDACPDTAGVPSDDPKKNGCPKAQIKEGKIEILEQVQFATASDRILPESDGILEAVLKILRQNVDLSKRVIAQAIVKLPRERGCGCGAVLQNSIMTQKKRIPSKIRLDLKPIIGKYLR